VKKSCRKQWVCFDKKDIVSPVYHVLTSTACGCHKPSTRKYLCAFGSKEALFLATLEHYSQHSIQKLQDCLKKSDTPLKGVRTFIETIVEGMMSCKEQRGCFLVNTVLEISPGKTLINEIVQKHLKATEAHLVAALTDALEAGELSPNQNPEVLAKYLLVNIWSLQVLAKTNPDSESVKSMLAQILLLLPE